MTKSQDKTSKAKPNGKKGASAASKAGSKSKSAPKGRGKNPGSQPPRIQLTLDQKLDLAGVVLIGIAAITLLSMVSSSQGNLTGPWIDFLRSTFGLGYIVVPIVLLVIGLWLLLRSF